MLRFSVKPRTGLWSPFTRLGKARTDMRQRVIHPIATALVTFPVALLGFFYLPGCNAWLMTTIRTAPAGLLQHKWVSSKLSFTNHVSTAGNANMAVGIAVTQRQHRACYQTPSPTISGKNVNIRQSTTSGLLYGSSWARGKANSDTRSRLRMTVGSDRGEDLSSRQTEERRVVVDMVRSGDADTDAGVPLVGDFQEKTPGKGSRREGSGLDKQIQLFVEMSTPFFKEDTSARWLLAGVVGLTLLNSGVSVAFSYIGRDFWTALSNKDPEQFNVMLQRFLLALTAGVPVTVFYRYQRSALALAWREWMTKRVMEIYYSGKTYYALEASKEIDNPDQRIAEDVRAFTQVSLEFLIAILTSCIDLASFSTILYSIYPELFVAILGYASVGTYVTTQLGGKLVGLNFDQLQTEADFRYSLIRVRENAESIAFYGGVQQELREIKRRFELALENYSDVIKAQRNLEFFTTAYRYLIQVLPGFVVAPLFFQGKIELGVVSQSYGAFNHILGDLSLIVNQFESLSAFSAGIDRLGEFLERMKAGSPGDSAFVGSAGADSAIEQSSETARSRGLLAAPIVVGTGDSASMPTSSMAHGVDDQLTDKKVLVGPEGGSQLVTSESSLVTETVRGAALRVDDVTVVTPTGGRVLVRGLSFELKSSERMLIVGESGAGKSSLLRAMAGLWTTGAGKIVRPTTDEMFFLPQRPYCTLGPLRDQITYPSSQLDDDADAVGGEDKDIDSTKQDRLHGASGSGAEDDELLSLLEKVDLGKLATLMGNGDAHAGLGAVRDWSDMLSLGEQQRLAFARLLYNKPALAILDESTSALDLNNETRMFALLDTLPDLSVVSVGHRPSLVQFHDIKLKLTSQGYSIESTGSNRDGGGKNSRAREGGEGKNGGVLASLLSNVVSGRGDGGGR